MRAFQAVCSIAAQVLEAGAIGGIDDPITAYLPELAERDPRFQRITIRHLLLMSSGLDYQESGWFIFNGDDPLTTYYPDQRTLSLTNIRIVEPPGQTFKYNRSDVQVQQVPPAAARPDPGAHGRDVDQRVGAVAPVDPLGMEFDGAWTLDSEASGFEKMEAGLNARAIDFAKLGRLFLHQGQWEGTQILSPTWVALATGFDRGNRAPQTTGGRYYALMWWGVEREAGPPDFYAAGDHGQYMYVSPRNRVVIVRTGVEYGVPSSSWIGAFTKVASGL
jgi:CubicO group peptidase (beta-lactamase class C family)